MENLINRLRQSGILIVIGFLLIFSIALGFVYWQQGQQQRELNKQIANLSLILSKPLPGAEKLQAEYDEVNLSLSPMSVEDALDIIVGIASESGIDVDPDSGKFNIPAPGEPGEQKVGEGIYEVLSLRSISAQGDYDSVMAFISALDSGKALKTMVLKRLDITQIEVNGEGEEEAEEAEIEAKVTLDVDIYTKPGE